MSRYPATVPRDKKQRRLAWATERSPFGPRADRIPWHHDAQRVRRAEAVQLVQPEREPADLRPHVAPLFQLESIAANDDRAQRGRRSVSVLPTSPGVTRQRQQISGMLIRSAADKHVELGNGGPHHVIQQPVELVQHFQHGLRRQLPLQVPGYDIPEDLVLAYHRING